MKTLFKSIMLIISFLSSLSVIAQQGNLLPQMVSNFNIGTVGNGYANNNLSNVNVTTDYSYLYNDNGLLGDNSTQHYAVGTNARWYSHNSFLGIETGMFEYGDHTTGSGNYMIVNGAVSSNIKVWEYTVPVIPGVIYEFEAYVTSLYKYPYGTPPPEQQPRLQLQINDDDVGDEFPVPWVNNQGSWTLWSQSWPANTPSARITIIDNCTNANGNDFGLDDIVFKMNEDYFLTANDFTVQYCGDLTPIELIQDEHYFIGYPPGGNSAPPLQVKIKQSIGAPSWGTECDTYFGNFHAMVGSDNRIYLTLNNPNFFGTDYVRYQVSRFGLTTDNKITINYFGPPSNCVPQGLPSDGMLCLDDVSLFNPSATWNTNGSQTTTSGWQWKKDGMSSWQNSNTFHSYVQGQGQNGLGTYLIQFTATNEECGDAEPHTETFTICDVPELYPEPYVTTICTSSTEPIGVNWNYNTGSKMWQCKRNNGNWVDFQCEWGEFDLLPGDQVRCRITYDYCGGSPLISNVINVVSGPEFISNIPDPFEEGYCPNSQVILPTIQSSWYDAFGMSVTPGWYYSPSYDFICGSAGGEITLNGSVSVTLGLQSTECDFIPYSPAFDLVVWEAPSIQGLENLPDSLGPVCAGTTLLSDILPELTPDGHYTDYGWLISAGQNPSDYNSNLPQILSATDDRRWLRYYVQSDCSQHNPNPVFSEPIRLRVGDKPTLSIDEMGFPDPICSGTSVTSFDVYVDDWHLFDSIFAGWEVSCNNGSSWEELNEFNESHNGCQVRYRATNQCGDELLLAGVVTVTEGPSFNNPGPLGFSDYYCDGSVLEEDDFPMPPVFDPHGFAVDPYWAYFDGTEYQEIQFPLQLTESWNGSQINYVLDSDCGGVIPYPTPFTLTVKGQPEVEISLNGSTTFCVDTSIPLNVEINWHLCTQNTQASSWLYASVDQPNNYSILYPMYGIHIPGEYNIKYLAVANECGFEAYSNSIRVTVEDAPGFENSGQPFELHRFCEGLELELPLAPSVTGHVDNALWRISVGTDPDGPYESVEPNYLNYHLTLDDNGRWLQYYAIGCDTLIHYEEEIHVDGKPLEEYEIEDICKGQTISYQLVYTNGYPVTDWEWKWENDFGEVRVFDPDVYTFDTEGNYSITYRVHNDCGWSVFQGPLPLTVTAGPEFDNSNSTLPTETQYVCEGTTVGELLSGITPPPLVDPDVPHDPLGWFIGDQAVELSTVITEAYHGDELRYGVRGDCSSVPVYSRGVPLYVYGRPEVTQMPPIGGFCEGDAVQLPVPEIDDHNGGENVTGRWQIQSNDGTWGDLPATWSVENDGAQIRYHLEHEVCLGFEYDSYEIPITIYTAPVIDDDDLPSNNLITICLGGALNIDEPDVLPATNVKGWQVSANGITDWGTALEGLFFDPSHVVDFFNGKYLRYHAESEQCPNLEDNSDVYIIQLTGAPSINDETWPDQVLFCSGGSLNIEEPEGMPGEWQVSVNGTTGWGTGIGDYAFDQNHIDDFFDGKFLRYYVHSSCGDAESKVMTLFMKDSEQMGAISGSSNVYVASSLISGIYRYEIDLEGINGPVTWSLSNDPGWQILEQEDNFCRVLVTMPGTAILTARFNVEECGEMERSFEINASFYGVDDIQNEVRIFPNPTKGSVTVEAEGIESLRLTDMVGQVLEVRECKHSDSVILNLGGYTPSVYLLEIKTVYGIAKKRIVLCR